MVRSEIAVLRFGLGARPGELSSAAGDPRGWLRAQIRGAVARAGDTPLAPCEQIFAGVLAARDEQRQMRRTGAGRQETDGEAKLLLNVLRDAYLPHYRSQVLARAQSAALTTRPFAERLVHFWANHFAISADKGAIFGLAGTLENEAIRPHVNGRFVELLTAVEQHPAMIAFLDNQYSAGADSAAAQRAAWRAAPGTPAQSEFGINENLAREILELHTLGVDGGYAQQDVTAFAQILTGWSIGGGKGRLAGGQPGRFYFRENLHEPGAKMFLRKRYPEAGQAQGEAVLADLARHPSTARFIATKLVRHFVADDPPHAVVERVADAFLSRTGTCRWCIPGCSSHPRRGPLAAQVQDSGGPRLLDSARLRYGAEQAEDVIRGFDLLGQRQYTPGSPAGWPDIAKAWDGSDALMHRVLWASRMAERCERGVRSASRRGILPRQLRANRNPDRAGRAASGQQALALLVMSPEFQRR